MNHKRGRSKSARAGCLMCKPYKLGQGQENDLGYSQYRKEMNKEDDKKREMEELSKRVRAAAKAGRITYAPTEQIDEYKEEAEEFLNGLLRVKRWAISDESSLGDFSGCGLPNTVVCDSPEAEYNAWKEWVIYETQHRFGIALLDVSILLIDLFKKIRENR